MKKAPLTKKQVKGFQDLIKFDTEKYTIELNAKKAAK